MIDSSVFLCIDSTKQWIELIAAISTPCIALLAVYYTRTQAKTDELRRKQELFDIRYAFYKKVRAIYMEIAARREPVDVTDFFDLAEEASFLFGKEVAEHIVSIADHKFPEQVYHGIIDDWFVKPFQKYLQLK